MKKEKNVQEGEKDGTRELILIIKAFYDLNKLRVREKRFRLKKLCGGKAFRMNAGT
jgi:hypothetical protein